MIVKLEELDANQLLECNVCIVGAGPAGITLAKELGNYGVKVILCEAGELDYSEQSQDCYQGKVIGDTYFPLDISRLRYFGGSSNHWGGWCRYFEKIDFKRNYLNKDLEWPINKKDLNYYFSESCNILGIKENFDEKKYDSSGIRKISFNMSEVYFKDKYLEYFKNSKNIKVILNANLIDVKTENKKIKNLYFKSYKGKNINIKSDINIFSMGGIENSRILLWFYEKYKENFCSNKIPIGKYWMEHPHFTLGEALVKKEILDANHFSLTDDVQIQEKILGCSLTIQKMNYSPTDKLAADLLCVAPKIGKKMMELINKKLACGVYITSAWEQEPVETNKITLSKTEKDKFGIPRPVLNWKKNELDKKTILKTGHIFNKWVKDNDLGRIKFSKWFANNENYPEDDMIGGHHHMGGTRMGTDILTSVVDKNCKLHGNDNLYIAGSSIFRTGGYNNPTLPIVQLSLRLADHLKKYFS